MQLLMNVATIHKRARSLTSKPANPFALAPSVLIRNEAAVTKGQFQKITLNITPGAKTRVEMLEGREHVVVPMVMMVEGVHNGSSGPIFYPWDELSKTPQIWNQKPVVVYHPAGSACDPDVVNNRKIGVIMNSKADDKGKRLPAEAWLERSRADAVDKRIFTAIDNNEMMELSTGLYVDAELTPGDWKGEEYVAIARNLRSDHLAILPDKIGACSVADGAGLLRNEVRKGKMPKNEILKRIMNVFGLTDNEMSHENIRAAIQTALRAKLNPNNAQGPWIWVEAVYDNFFVYDDGEGKLFRLGYSTSDTKVTLSDETPVEVARVTEFRTVDGAKFVGNQDQTKTNSDMNKAQMIAAILAANIGWSESKALEGLSDKQVESIHNGLKKPAEATPPAATATTNATPAAGTPAPAAAAPSTQTTTAPAPSPVTLAEWEKTAPPEVVAAFRGIKNAVEAEEAQLIDKITKNEAMGFKAEDLKGTPIANLRKLAKIAEVPATQNYNGYAPVVVPPAPDYSGMAPAGSVTNASGATEIKPLGRPIMNFRKEEKGKGAAAAAA
jgi:hypothetical protein